MIRLLPLLLLACNGKSDDTAATGTSGGTTTGGSTTGGTTSGGTTSGGTTGGSTTGGTTTGGTTTGGTTTGSTTGGTSGTTVPSEGWPWTHGAAGTTITASYSDIAPDDSVLIMGQFEETIDFGAGAITSHGYRDNYLARVSTDGALQWGVTWGNRGTEDSNNEYHGANSLAATADGGAVAIGWFWEPTDLDPTVGEDWATPQDDSDTYAIRLDGSGNHLWSAHFAGETRVDAWAVASTSDGGVVIGGSFNGTVDLDPGAGEDIRTATPGDAAFLVKLDRAGAVVWAHTLDSQNDVSNPTPFSIDEDGDGNLTVIGSYTGAVDFDPGADEAILGSGVDTWSGTFVARYDPDGALLWVTDLAGDGDSRVTYGGDVNSAGEVVLAGIFSEAVDFDPGPADDTRDVVGSWDVFVTALDSEGTYSWTAALGSKDYDGDPPPVHIAEDGSVYVHGWAGAAMDFDPTAGEQVVDPGTDGGGYLWKLTSSGELDWVSTTGGDLARGPMIDSTATWVISFGAFSSEADLNLGSGEDLRTPVGDTDVFLTQTPVGG